MLLVSIKESLSNAEHLLPSAASALLLGLAAGFLVVVLFLVAVSGRRRRRRGDGYGSSSSHAHQLDFRMQTRVSLLHSLNATDQALSDRRRSSSNGDGSSGSTLGSTVDHDLALLLVDLGSGQLLLLLTSQTNSHLSQGSVDLVADLADARLVLLGLGHDLLEDVSNGGTGQRSGKGSGNTQGNLGDLSQNLSNLAERSTSALLADAAAFGTLLPGLLHLSELLSQSLAAATLVTSSPVASLAVALDGLSPSPLALSTFFSSLEGLAIGHFGIGGLSGASHLTGASYTRVCRSAGFTRVSGRNTTSVRTFASATTACVGDVDKQKQN